MGLDGFDSLVYHKRQIDRLFAKLYLAAADAAHIEQIVDKTDHLTDLTFHHCSCRVDVFHGAPGMLDDFQGTSDGRKRVAKFMGQDGNEFVLATVCFSQGRLGFIPFNKVRRLTRKYVYKPKGGLLRFVRVAPVC